MHGQPCGDVGDVLPRMVKMLHAPLQWKIQVGWGLIFKLG